MTVHRLRHAGGITCYCGVEHINHEGCVVGQADCAGMRWRLCWWAREQVVSAMVELAVMRHAAITSERPKARQAVGVVVA